MKSAEARLQATGMFQTTAMRSKALTSGSCGCGCSGSQKKMTRSTVPSAMRAPICWSPPRGPLCSLITGVCNASSSSVPVVPVANSSWWANRSRLY